MISESSIYSYLDVCFDFNTVEEKSETITTAKSLHM